MKGKWKVESNIIDGKQMYRAYRLIDTNAIDHSGNREYQGGYVYEQKSVHELIRILELSDNE